MMPLNKKYYDMYFNTGIASVFRQDIRLMKSYPPLHPNVLNLFGSLFRKIGLPSPGVMSLVKSFDHLYGFLDVALG
jgi:hypothetical protein